MVGVKASKIREAGKNRDQLLNDLEKYKSDLAKLRVAKVASSSGAKLAQIKVVRKNIARTLTIYNQDTKKSLREKYAGSKFTPVDLRPKKTRAIRRRLTPEQANKKTPKAVKRSLKIPKRTYALKA